MTKNATVLCSKLGCGKPAVLDGMCESDYWQDPEVTITEGAKGRRLGKCPTCKEAILTEDRYVKEGSVMYHVQCLRAA